MVNVMALALLRVLQAGSLQQSSEWTNLVCCQQFGDAIIGAIRECCTLLF